jgi:hypothetical protein
VVVTTRVPPGFSANIFDVTLSPHARITRCSSRARSRLRISLISAGRRARLGGSTCATKDGSAERRYTVSSVEVSLATHRGRLAYAWLLSTVGEALRRERFEAAAAAGGSRKVTLYSLVRPSSRVWQRRDRVLSALADTRGAPGQVL